VAFDLPNQWLWDIIDEFIYQYQTFCHFRDRCFQARQAALEAQETVDDDVENVYQVLNDNNQIWNTYSVLNILHAFVDKSNVTAQLHAIRNGQDLR
jgi:translation initiation factor 3 subunit L